MGKLCRHCGLEFERMYAIFCSKKCSDAAAYINRKGGNTHLSIQDCKNCGSTFQQSKSTQFCCSKQCSSNLYRRSVGPERRRSWAIKSNYGITQDEWNDLYADQNGLCQICKRSLEGIFRGLATDHCHATGKVRGILCSECNLGLGYFKDSPELMHRAAEYIEDSRSCANSTAEFVIEE